jgi:spore coat polysaccharide biosynthesis protein SpsF
MGSSRLSGKVVLPLAGQALISRMVERVRRSKLCGSVVVAVTTDSLDETIIEVCQQDGIDFFRGDPLDLLARHYHAARLYQAEVVLKIPSDCPLIDPQIIDRVVGFYLDHPGQYDYVSNLHPATYPDGNDVEVMSFQALETAFQEAKRPLEREHTTPFFWENPDRFRIGNVRWETGKDYAMSHRWTIDYPEDYRFIRSVYEALYPQNPAFGWQDILDLLEQREDLVRLNRHYAGVNWYRHHLDDLKTIDACQTKKMEGLRD